MCIDCATYFVQNYVLWPKTLMVAVAVFVFMTTVAIFHWYVIMLWRISFSGKYRMTMHQFVSLVVSGVIWAHTSSV